MSYLEGKSQKEYYQSNTFGSYQFVSLNDIVSQFMVAYVGEEKLINKANRIDVAFFAQRALAELSFDTLKSFKSQSIVLPPTLVMPLPHDYVNYTRLSWCDDAGIKHPLYRTNDTSNPFQVTQDSDGNYIYGSSLANEELSEPILLNNVNGWTKNAKGLQGKRVGENILSIGADTDGLTIAHRPHNKNNVATVASFVTYCYKAVDVSLFQEFTFSADVTTKAASTQTVSVAQTYTDPDDSSSTVLGATGTFNTPATTIRIGLSSQIPDTSVTNVQMGILPPSQNSSTDIFDIGYVEWTAGESGIKTSSGIDVSSIQGEVYLVIIGIAPWTENDGEAAKAVSEILEVTSTVSSITLDLLNPITQLSSPNNSSTWDKYKALTPSENNNDDYANDDYQRVPDERYGLDPSKAQTNGSFYIDDRIGRIHFSSNISGKTVILDYISDSLGTEKEMVVHKFAEEAMYKSIAYGILSTKVNIPEFIVRRTKKEKFAATRQAKLRLSSIKLEDITQTLRGKSKHIKH